jgi:hypothetical protein
MVFFITPVVYGTLNYESWNYVFYLLPWFTGLSIHLIATGILGDRSALAEFSRS